MASRIWIVLAVAVAYQGGNSAAVAPALNSLAGGQAVAVAVTTPLQTTKLTALLVTISDWILQSGVGSNQLNNATYWDPPDAIFINANLARVLLAAYKITGKKEYVAVGT